MRERILIKKLGINGEGIGYINKKICFVPGVLPNEEVEIEVIEKKPKYLKGKVTKIIKASPDRSDVYCKENKECQGCSLLHLNYSQHLVSKKSWINDALIRYSKENQSHLIDVIPANQREYYRDIVRLPIVYFNKQLHVGIYQRESHYLTLMENCLLQNKAINEVIHQILDIFNKYQLKDYYDKFKTGLRFIELRAVEDKVQVLIICGKDEIKKEVLDEIRHIKNVVGLFYSVNTAKNQDFRLEGYKKVFGNTSMSYYINDTKFLNSIKSDYPLNIKMEETKINVIKSLINNNAKIISINHGIGTLELSLNNQITAIDSLKSHHEDAVENMRFLKKNNVEWIKGDINEEVVKKCKKNKYDVLIYNSIERGLSEAIFESMVKSKINEFIYVTTHYSTMAKELKNLNLYYDLETIIPLDYEPYTSQVLTIVKMKRKR